MPLIDFLAYRSGFVPKSDADAQQHCYKYLCKCVNHMKSAEQKEPQQDLLNLIQIYEGIENVTQAAKGSMRRDRAATFWQYWDRNKRQIIAIEEQTNDDYAIQDKIGELEEGRYIPS